MIGTQVWKIVGESTKWDKERYDIEREARDWNARPRRYKRNGKIINK